MTPAGVRFASFSWYERRMTGYAPRLRSGYGCESLSRPVAKRGKIKQTLLCRREPSSDLVQTESGLCIS